MVFGSWMRQPIVAWASEIDRVNRENHRANLRTAAALDLRAIQFRSPEQLRSHLEQAGLIQS